MNKKSFIQGIFYGLSAHTFCILFVIFSTIGAATATTLLRPLLLNENFFYFLVVLSFVFATLSAIFYLRRNDILSIEGVKRKQNYLFILYSTTVFVNLLLFLVIFPLTANLDFSFSNKSVAGSSISSSMITLRVNIPCSGHAGLITGDLRTIKGVEKVVFRFPSYFDVYYNQKNTSEKEILSLEVFKTYQATVVK